MQVADLDPTLRQAIVVAREAGLTKSATELEERSSAACTTSSEWLGEVGEAILEFRSREGKRVPRELDKLFDECLYEIGKVWPKYRRGLLSRLLDRICQMWTRTLLSGLVLLLVFGNLIGVGG